MLKLLFPILITSLLFGFNAEEIDTNINENKHDLHEISKKMYKTALLKEVSEFPFFKNSKDIDFLYAKKRSIGTSNLFQIRTNEGDFFVIKTKSKQFYLIPGTNIVQSYSKSTNLFSPLYINQDLTDIKKNALLKIGNGKNEVIYVTNFECPHCKSLHERMSLQPDLFKKYTFYIIPISFGSAERRSKKSEMMIEKILLAKTQEEKQNLYNNYMNGNHLPTVLNRGEASLEGLEKKVNQFEKYAQKIGAAGTPTFFGMDARPINVMEILYSK